MSVHETFKFKTLEELREKIAALQVEIDLQDDLTPLSEEVVMGGKSSKGNKNNKSNKKAPNSLAVLPMEGCDSQPDGSPSELVERRYLRFASGGAGLLWWEACAVVPEGRANPLQMMLTKNNVSAFAKLLKQSNGAAADTCGAERRPLHILQLTHSGRYSRPQGEKPMPVFPQHDPVLDGRSGVTPEMEPVSDEYLDALPEHYIHSALLAREAGFDGVDIKACHRYLLNELLASRTRGGKYGGGFENRSRLLLDTVRAVKQAVGEDFIVACRFNVFDAHPYPYGFGEGRSGLWEFDPEEPLRLVDELCEAGAGLLSNSAGNPYYIYPQVTRPFDQSSTGIPVPEEHPLESIARLFAFTRLIQKRAGSVPVVGNGYTWLRQFLPYAGAANLKNGGCRMVGLGRSSFAYPDASRDILTGKGMDAAKCCTTCSKCTQIMRDRGRTGCAVRDAKLYAPLYKQYRAEAAAR